MCKTIKSNCLSWQDINKMKRIVIEMKRLFKEKKGPMVLIALFLFVNIMLYFLGEIEAKTAVLSTVATSYFSQHIEDFEFKKFKNYL